MFFILLFPVFGSLLAFLIFRIFSILLRQSMYKRKTQFAIMLADLIQEQGIIAQVKAQINPAAFAKLEPKIEEQITYFLEKKLTIEIPVLGMFADDKLMGQAKEFAQREIMEALPTLVKSFMEEELTGNKLELLIEEKIQLVPSPVWERIVDRLAKPLLLKIQMVGAVLGFVLGVSYIFFMYLYAWIFV